MVSTIEINNTANIANIEDFFNGIVSIKANTIADGDIIIFQERIYNNINILLIMQ